MKDMQEDLIIKHIDQRRYAVKDPKPTEVGLKVRILELIMLQGNTNRA